MSDLDEFIDNNPLPKKTDLHDMDDKHKLMLDAIAPYARPAQKNLDKISLTKQCTKNTKVMLILMPEWAYMFPPFNIARLAAVSEAVEAVEQQLGERGRVLLRPSGTEPVVRVMVEGEEGAEVSSLCERLAADVERILG